VALERQRGLVMALPIYSFGNRGIASKPADLWYQYVGLKHINSYQYNQPGKYRPLEMPVHMRDTSAVHIMSCLPMPFHPSVQMEYQGRITEESYQRLFKLYVELLNKGEPQDGDDDGATPVQHRWQRCLLPPELTIGVGNRTPSPVQSHSIN